MPKSNNRPRRGKLGWIVLICWIGFMFAPGVSGGLKAVVFVVTVCLVLALSAAANHKPKPKAKPKPRKTTERAGRDSRQRPPGRPGRAKPVPPPDRRAWLVPTPNGDGYLLYRTDTNRPRFLTNQRALAVALDGEWDTDTGPIPVTAEEPLRGLADAVIDGGSDREPKIDQVRATLRPHQLRGVAWLQFLADMGMGAILADDMGLGKTLQTIALLAGRTGDRPHLVVCPTSVLGNWEREIGKFAPHLTVMRHHGTTQATTADDFPAGAVILTSYGMLWRTLDLLGEVEWDVVVVDEAQNIKNHNAHAAKAARSLTSQMRVALSGTPVENRLSELWAIMEFANPGLLGSIEGYKQHYARPIEKHGCDHTAGRLRRATEPFMLRRLKKDPDIAPELPGTAEKIVPCAMTDEQRDLYRTTVDEFLGDGKTLGEGIARHGRVLALLTKLKQICNHPAQALGQPDADLEGRSGKLDYTTQVLADAVAAGERALIFTQYQSMGNLLARHLRDSLGLDDVPFLHGGVSRKKRDQMVDAFQDDPDAPPLLIISIKAGGAGLNLVAARHVVHYDRWWNPAVEDQATDRANRIGQTGLVHVHKLVTEGTLEERISAMLTRKRDLADTVVKSQEARLAELDDNSIRKLVAL